MKLSSLIQNLVEKVAIYGDVKLTSFVLSTGVDLHGVPYENISYEINGYKTKCGKDGLIDIEDKQR